MSSAAYLGITIVCFVGTVAVLYLIGRRYAFNPFSARMIAGQCAALLVGVAIGCWALIGLLPPGGDGTGAAVAAGTFSAVLWLAMQLRARHVFVRMLRQGKPIPRGVSEQTVAAARERLQPTDL